ncbi:MAG TPA: TolC family protein, partial [Chryseosolibacter sp.]
MKNNSIGLIALAMIATLNLYAQPKKLSLQEALAIAAENNKALKAEILDIKSAQAETEISRGSMLPAISASGGYSYYFDRQVIFMPGAFTGNDTEPVVDVAVGGKNVFNTYLSLQQPIVGEAARRQIRSAQLNETIQQLDVKGKRANLMVVVTATYYRALLVQETIELNRQSLMRNIRSLEDSRQLFLQGKSLKVDTLRNFIVVENLKTTVSYLENQRKVIMLQLQHLLGQNTDDEIILTDSLTNQPEDRSFAAVESVYADAIQNRHDIQMQKLHVELSKNLLRQRNAQRLPTLSLVGMYQLQAQADDRKFDSYRWPRTSFVGLQANVPIFTGNKINVSIRQSNIQLQKSMLQLEDATQKANTEIATLQNNFKEVIQRLSIQERTVHAAEANFRIVNDRYKNGLSSRLELSDAELALTEAKMNQLTLIFNLKIAKLQLDKALGIL